MNDNNNVNIENAIVAGLEALNDPQVRVPVSQVEDLTVLKNVLKAVLNGQLVLASPDRILPPEADKNPEGKENLIEEK